MITYFSEKDLVSFGSFCLSDTRKKIYLSEGIAEDRIDNLLSTVNPADIKHWFNIIIRQRQEQEKVLTQTEIKQNEG